MSQALKRLPQMADFALWTTTAEAALDWQLGSFMMAYTESHRDANGLSFEASTGEKRKSAENLHQAVQALVGQANFPISPSR